MKSHTAEMHEGPEAFARFENTMRGLLKVPHSAIKAKLDAEKAAKRHRSKKPVASKG